MPLGSVSIKRLPRSNVRYEMGNLITYKLYYNIVLVVRWGFITILGMIRGVRRPQQRPRLRCLLQQSLLTIHLIKTSVAKTLHRKTRRNMSLYEGHSKKNS